VRAAAAAALAVAALGLGADPVAASTSAVTLMRDADSAVALEHNAITVVVLTSSPRRVRVTLTLRRARGEATLTRKAGVGPVARRVRVRLSSAARRLLTGCAATALTATVRGSGITPATTTATAAPRAPQCAAPAPVARPAASTAPGTPGIAVSGGFADQAPDAIARDLDLIAATGARWLRVALDWARVQPDPATLDWSRFDAVVAGALARGIHVLLVPTYAPAWAQVAGGTSPRSRVQFAQFAGRAVAHYGAFGVRDWEVWNEPNLQRFWQPRVSASAYAALLRSTASTIHALDPGARVLSGGLARTYNSGASVTATHYLQRLARTQALREVDGVAVHTYSYPLRPSARTDDPRNAWAELDARSPSVRSILRDAGLSHKRVWITEFGAPTAGTGAVTESEQAAILSDGYALARSDPSTGPVFWYSNRDLPTIATNDPERYFGLWRADFTAKPAVGEFAAAVTASS
jgi:hypothetical protein